MLRRILSLLFGVSLTLGGFASQSVRYSTAPFGVSSNRLPQVTDTSEHPGSTQVIDDLITIRYPFQPPLITRSGEYDRINLPGLSNYGKPGEPSLPYKIASILLPYGKDFSGVEVILGNLLYLGEGYHIEPGQELLPARPEPRNPRRPNDPAVYQSNDPIPAEPFAIVSVQRLAGYDILLLQLFPVLYTPVTGEVSYYDSLEVKVTTVDHSDTAESQGLMIRTGLKDENRLGDIVDNPDLIETYHSADRQQGMPVSSLVDPGEPMDYILLTKREMSSAFQPLIDWKTSQGLQAGIFTVEDIYANYTGLDKPDKIRNFILDAYSSWSSTEHPLEYVLLGGDDEIIPVRYLHEPGSGSSDGLMPSDMYYAGLDGNWDADGDGLYGEESYASTQEECDFFAEVFLGRMTVDRVDEVTNIVNKTLNYEQNPYAEYLNQMLLIGAQLDSYTQGGDSKDLIAALLKEFISTKLYDRDGTYNQDAMMESINRGTHLVNYDGHGSWTGSALYIDQIDTLSNDQYFLYYDLGCHTAAFDQPTSGDTEAAGEHYLINEHGAFAYIGNTRYGWYSGGSTNGPGNILDRTFFDTATNKDVPNIGKALQLSKEYYYTNYWQDRFSILTLVLLGDPQTPLVSKFLAPFAEIGHPENDSILRGSTNITGTASEGEAEGATFSRYWLEISLESTPENWFQIGETSYSPVTEGILVSGWDTSLVPDGDYTMRLLVDDGQGRFSEDRTNITLDNVYITSPAAEDFFRAGDLIPITGTVASTDFQSYVLEYGKGDDPTSWNLIGGTFSPATDELLWNWDTREVTEADSYTIRLTMIGSVHTSADMVKIYLDPTQHAGWPQKVTNRLFGPSMATGDIDGDGDVEVVASGGDYDDYSSRLYVWNQDGTLVDGWDTAIDSDRLSPPTLADLDRDGDLEILAGTGSNKFYAWHHDGSLVKGWPIWAYYVNETLPAVGDIVEGGTLEIAFASRDGAVYVVSSDGTILPNWPMYPSNFLCSTPSLGDLDGDGDLELVIGANYGQVYAWHHDGRFVEGWPKETSQDGPICSSPALADLDGNQDLEVIIGADRLYAWHHTGRNFARWPRSVGKWVNSSPAIGDLDGNGTLDVVVGSDQVYAWSANGNRLDGWPVALDIPTNSSPVIADIDGDEDMEVVIGSGDEDNRLYAWHHDASVVEGWPKNVPSSTGPPEGHALRMASPLITDIDLDDHLEVALGIENRMLVWDISAPYDKARIEWGMFHHDEMHTGLYSKESANLPPLAQDVAASPQYVPPGGQVRVTARVSDENGVSSVSAEFGSQDGTSVGRIPLYDDGLHEDGEAADGLYGNTWNLPDMQADFQVDIIAIDNLSRSFTYNNAVRFTSRETAYIQLKAFHLQVDDRNFDGVANPGEDIWFAVELENIGPLDAHNVSTFLSINDFCVYGAEAITPNIGDIPAGTTASSPDHNYFFNISSECPHSHTLEFSLSISSEDGNTWEYPIEISVVDSVGPEFACTEATPEYIIAGEPVTIWAYCVSDASGIRSIQAIINSAVGNVSETINLYDDGAHDDIEEKDGIYGATWITLPEPEEYYVDLLTEDRRGNKSLFKNRLLFSTLPPFTKTSDLLLVIDDPYANYPVMPYYTRALEEAGYSYDLWDINRRGQIDETVIGQYLEGAVIWASPGYGALTSLSTEIMQSYLDNGGRLFITGQDIGRSNYWTKLYTDYLHASYLSDSSNSSSIIGMPGDPIGDSLITSIDGGDGIGNEYSPDEILPISPAVTSFLYGSRILSHDQPSGTESPETGSSAAIRIDTGVFKVVYFAFGFEEIYNSRDRTLFMQRVVAWLLNQDIPLASFSTSSPDWLGQETDFNNTTFGRGSVTYLWDFGDGNTSTMENPTHPYAAPGTYEPILIASSPSKSSVFTSTVTIYGNPQADFTSDVASGSNPLTATFTNTTTTIPPGDPTLTFQWDFGDGESSNLAEPVHGYGSPGFYKVTLAAANAAGEDIKEIYLLVGNHLYFPIIRN